jgi:hypothetical protein
LQVHIRGGKIGEAPLHIAARIDEAKGEQCSRYQRGKNAFYIFAQFPTVREISFSRNFSRAKIKENCKNRQRNMERFLYYGILPWNHKNGPAKGSKQSNRIRAQGGAWLFAPAS